MENTTILHHHNDDQSEQLPPSEADKMKKVDDISLDNHGAEPPVQQLAGVSLEGKGKSV